jgi:hypothetical protein
MVANDTIKALTTAIASANDQLVNGNITAQDRASLLAARDQAQKVLADVTAAVSLLNSAPTQLQNFAYTIMRGAAAKVITGTQNIETALATIRATPTTVSTTPAIKPGTAGAAGARPSVSIPELLNNLQTASTAAAAVAKRITDAWDSLKVCSPPAT